MDTVQILQFGLDAISLGALYATLALGLALLFGVMGIMNFAYGELIMVGAFVLALTQSWGFFAAVAMVFVAVTTMSVLQERVAFRPVRDADPTTMLVTAFALSVFLQNLALVTVGARARGVRLPDAFRAQLVFGDGELRIPALNVYTVLAVVICLLLLGLLLRKTRLGLELRAATFDFEMARLVGVRADRVIASAFALTGVLASVATLVLVGQIGHASPTMGLSPLLIAFVGTVLGGMYSLMGSALGGFILGTLITVLGQILPRPVVPYRMAIAFALVIVLLLLRPQGLIVTKRAAERV